MNYTRTNFIPVLALLGACVAPGPTPTDQVVISIVGTNDVHGELSLGEDRGGLTLLSGYVNALREVREEDGGAVLLIDAGDMWQGTLESNLNEGASVVAAFNALNYTAAAIGNHEFDFGPVGPKAIPDDSEDDPRGALKQRASEASFPMLAANLIDRSTGNPVDWPNVQPSVLIQAGGINVGIIGVMTKHALQASIAANVVGLHVAPLALVIEQQARTLRNSGADLVIVTAHAGGMCSEFDDPDDLSSCNQSGEIFRVARALPAGLVDHIIAGHNHQGIAHIVNGVSITSSYKSTLAFGRVDFVVDKTSGKIVDRHVFPPQRLLSDVEYEGRQIKPDSSVVTIADRAEEKARDEKQRSLGIELETPFTLEGNPESILGNLFTDALLESIDADIAIHNVSGGLRADLSAGELNYGGVYQVFPFDNRVVVFNLSGADLRRIVANEAHRGHRSMGFSGMRVFVSCRGSEMTVGMGMTDTGQSIEDDDTVSVIANDFLAFGGDDILSPAIPDGGFDIDTNMPFTRDVFERWLVNHGGAIRAPDFATDKAPKWNRPDPLPSECQLR